ncbi:MAG: sulfurtransferase [Ignavibacteriales bacterium]|nr:sulfurtransferase [Ignavibacteriales bacterium]
MKDPDVVVLHVAFNRREYSVGHIPGARFLWYNWLAVSTPDASTEMPPAEQADTLMESFGITDKSTIVLCFGGNNVSTTTRMFLALSYFGFGNQTSVLDGGFETWKKENRPVSTETPMVKRTTLKLSMQPSVITDADWIKSNLTNVSVAVVDARTRIFYEGNGGGIVRQGHIKGAVNIPFNSVLDTSSKLLNKERLQHIFDSVGVKKGMKVVSYCHVGQQATVIYSVARMLGYDAAVYDGSFEDWNVRSDDYPVEKPAPPEVDHSAEVSGKKYICPPCGGTCDRQEYSKPGSCPACTMTLIEKKS